MSKRQKTRPAPRAEKRVDTRKEKRLAQLRQLVIDTADKLPDLGGLQETTKWGQLSFLPAKPRIGTTVRLGVHDETHVALYVHCQTDLISTFRTVCPELEYSGNRALLVPLAGRLPTQSLRLFIEAALLYHLHKRRKLAG
ncbi:MAG: DUF1801 domain-containing protein [Pseudomonadota bacterium]